MTWIRTPMGSHQTPNGISRSSRLEATIRVNVVEGVTIERVTSIAHIAVTGADDRGMTTTAGLDLSRAELRHLAGVFTDLADLLDREA